MTLDCEVIYTHSVLSVSGFEEGSQWDLPVWAGGLRCFTLHLLHPEHLLCPQPYQVAAHAVRNVIQSREFYMWEI